MEGELWRILYRWILAEASKRPRRKRVRFSDAWILAVFCWAVINDRPVRWACRRKNWPPEQRWRDLPSDSTMSGRLKTLSVLQLLQAVMDRLASWSRSRSESEPEPDSEPEPGPRLEPLVPVRVVDAKPLPVGGHSKDRDARWGQATAGHKAKGYKMFDIWGGGGNDDRVILLTPAAWTLGPMNLPEPDVARSELLRSFGHADGDSGYLLGDSLYDSNPLHEACASRGLQLVAPRKKPGTGLGHREHQPSRLRSIDLTEMHTPGNLPASGPAPFGRDLYHMRGSIERKQGNLCSFGGGLAPLPAWVRRPRRVARWVAVKLVINGLRQCRLHKLHRLTT